MNFVQKIIVDGKETKLVKKPAIGNDIVKMLGISPQEALMKLDGKMRPLESSVGKAKKIEIIRVVFGG